MPCQRVKNGAALWAKPSLIFVPVPDAFLPFVAAAIGMPPDDALGIGNDIVWVEFAVERGGATGTTPQDRRRRGEGFLRRCLCPARRAARREMSGANAALVSVDNRGMTPFRTAGALAVALTAPWLWAATAHAEAFAQLGQVPVVASPTCAGSVSAEAQVTPVLSTIVSRTVSALRSTTTPASTTVPVRSP